MYASYQTGTAYNALPEWSPRDDVLTRRDRAETIWFAIVPGARENLEFTKTLMVASIRRPAASPRALRTRAAPVPKPDFKDESRGCVVRYAARPLLFRRGY